MAEQPIRVTPMRGLVDRLMGAVADRIAPAVARQVSETFQATYFGPGQPLMPREPAGADPRLWQYPPGINIVTTPRAYEPVGFDLLRNLADTCDMVRVCIEMRKDQLCGMEWTIVTRDETTAPADVGQAIAAAKNFFASPDRESSWDAWLRALLEDVLVYDALTLYVRRSRSGALYAIEPVDGSTIKPLLDAQGRTPRPPDPAYHQVLYGYPNTAFTRDELLYRPKNRRNRSAYGSSPVEWIILSINAYLRRQLFNLGYYTEGNIPEGFGTMPEGWTPEQIRQFQEWFDSLISGNVEQQRKIRFVPSGFDLKGQRTANFEVQLEEWLARIVTAAFQVSYQRFIQRVVRATAEQAAAEQADLGLEPLKRFISGVVNEILTRYLGLPYLQHQFVGGEFRDEKAQTEKRARYVDAGIMARDEVRELEGLEAFGLPMTQAPTVTTPGGPVLLTEVQGAAVQGSTSDQPPTPDIEAAKADIARWRRKALKAFREGKAERALEFESTAILPDVHGAIARRLAGAKTEGDVVAAFEVAARPFRGTTEPSNARTVERFSGREAGRGPGHAGPVRPTRCADHVPYP